MAIFLLIYVLILLVWFGWGSILSYVLLKYRYPDNIGLTVLIVFWGFSVLILLISIVFIAKGDWVSVPDVFKTLGA